MQIVKSLSSVCAHYSPIAAIGDSITCAFGTGRVIEFRPHDKIYVVKLYNWHLAQGQSPTLFLNDSSLKQAVNPTIIINPMTEPVTQDKSR